MLEADRAYMYYKTYAFLALIVVLNAGSGFAHDIQHYFELEESIKCPTIESKTT